MVCFAVAIAVVAGTDALKTTGIDDDDAVTIVAGIAAVVVAQSAAQHNAVQTPAVVALSDWVRMAAIAALADKVGVGRIVVALVAQHYILL